MKFVVPSAFTRNHQFALKGYLGNPPQYNTPLWETIYEAIDLLETAQVLTDQSTWTFRQLYAEYVERPFANKYIEQLLATDNVSKDNARIAALFARQIVPTLQQAGLLGKELPESWLLLTYCVYWWQSFAKGYAFEVEIMRDLAESDIDFQMHDLRNPLERYSPADLTVLGLWGDIKTSTYFLQWQSEAQLRNDFYITRLYERGKERTLVVFQKPAAWASIDGKTAVPGTLSNILNLLPTPVALEQRGIILIVVDYETWKQMVHDKQIEAGLENE